MNSNIQNKNPSMLYFLEIENKKENVQRNNKWQL